MPFLYETTTGKGLLLYSHINMIILRHKNDHAFSQPLLMADDYKSSLFDMVYNSTIYFTYISNTGDIVVRSILDQTFPCLINKPIDSSFYSPKLVEFDGRLLLFYTEKNKESYTIKCMIPYQNKQYITYDFGSFTVVPALSFCCLEKDLIISLNTPSSKKLYSLSSSYTFKEIPLDSEKYIAEISNLKNMLQSAQNQYNELMNVAEQYRNEAIKWNNRFKGISP